MQGKSFFYNGNHSFMLVIIYFGNKKCKLTLGSLILLLKLKCLNYNIYN